MDILVYGIINSFSLTLMAIGFTLVYGISRLPNFAHGALYVGYGISRLEFLAPLEAELCDFDSSGSCSHGIDSGR